MQTNALIHFFEKNILDFNIEISECDIENGIHFLFPTPISTSKHMVFCGDLSDWNILVEKHLLIEGSTYLITISNEEYKNINLNYKGINLILIKLSIPSLTKKITALLSSDSFDVSFSEESYIDFWKNVIDKKYITQNQILSAMKSFPYKMHSHIAVIVITSNNSSNEDINFKTALFSFFENTNIFKYDDEWIVLYSQSEDTSDILDISYSDFSDILQKYNMSAGISYACQLPELYKTMYLTASASIKLGTSLAVQPRFKGIYSYHQYSPYYLIWLSEKSFTQIHDTTNLIYLAHPDIARLYFYDIDKNSNLIDILFVYLSCGQNLALASKELYMHKNTVLNKLKKIESIVHHSLDYDRDYFVILLSCMILKYQKEYSKDNLENYYK